MSITDELREWWLHKFPVMDKKLHDDFTAIADRIDEQHEDMRYDFQHEFDGWKFIRDTQWVELPKDADGEPIHIGDKLEFEHNGLVRTVESFALSEYGWQVFCKSGGGFIPSQTRCHHIKPDSWESIIQDAVKLGYADYPTTSYEAELVERCRRLAGAE